MANEKPTPEQLALLKQLFEGRLNHGISPSLTLRNQQRAAQAMREIVYAKYSKYRLVNFPGDFPVPIEGKLILNERSESDPAPFPCLLCDMTPAFDRKTVKEVRRKMLDERDGYEHLVLSNDDWRELYALEVEHAKKLPMPFYHEALQSFTIHSKDDGFEASFCRSSLPRVKYEGYDIVPLVDCLLKIDGNQPMLFGLGVVDNELDIYQVAMYWFGNVNKRHHQGIVGDLTCYFYAQWAFHACPERIIEVRPGEPDPFSDEPAPVPQSQPVASQPQSSKKRQHSDRPRNVSIGRRIYVRDYPLYSNDGSREYERHCRCWYVHGFMRTNHKTGKQTWINGYFKGPDRDVPAARRHVKNYVMD